MIKILRIATLFIFLVISFIYAFDFFSPRVSNAKQESDSNEKSFAVRNKIEDGFKKINSYIVDFKTTDFSGETTYGRAFYKAKPQRYFKTISTLQTGEKVITFDQNNSHIIFLPSSNIAIKKKSTKDITENYLNVLSDINAFNNIVAYEKAGYYNYDVMLPLPKPSAVTEEMPIKIKAFINKDHGYIEKIIFINQKNAVLEIQEFTNYQLNIPIEDKEFEFIPPVGCRIAYQEEVSPRN